VNMERHSINPASVKTMIPTLNEEKGVGEIIDSFRMIGYRLQ